ncbi:hypothetical protein AB0M80_14415 [Amycolatopsis sp. NPDC051045]|uniref:hypothetical protein n=1 Tax=Amycolatopsis sp. NPDC051045 TaxID=3156922 RepID=UPI003425AD81
MTNPTTKKQADQSGPWTRISTLLSQTVLLSALLYYFGWVRTQAVWEYFGIDTSLLGFSTPDYALRSINSTILPLIGFGILALSLATLHRTVFLPAATAARSTSRRRLADGAIIACYAAGGLTLAAIGIGFLIPASINWAPTIALSFMLLTATGLIAYLDHLRSLQMRMTSRHPREKSSVRPSALAALAAIGALWSVSSYARTNGEQSARDVADHLNSRPAIALYSVGRLAVSGPGISITEISQKDSKYKFCYTGLVSLIHTSDKYLLTSQQWRHGRDAVYVIPISGDVRIDAIAR